MKKLFSIFIILILVSSFSFAQEKGKMMIAVDGALALPFGTFGDVYKMGFGGKAAFMYFVSNNIAVSLTSGYLRWDVDLVEGYYSAIPVMAGARYTFGKDKLLPYVMVHTGMFFGSAEITVGTVTVSSSGSDFGAGGGVGLFYQVGNKVFLDVNAQMNAIFGDGDTQTFAEFNLGAAFCLN